MIKCPINDENFGKYSLENIENIWKYFECSKDNLIISKNNYTNNNYTNWWILEDSVLNNISSKLSFFRKKVSSRRLLKTNRFFMNNFINVLSVNS